MPAAELVWAKMKSNNSRECHSVDYMAPDEQQDRARRRHEQIIKSGSTCTITTRALRISRRMIT